MQLVHAGDNSKLDQFLSAMSPSERELAFKAETVTGGTRSPLLVAVKGGDVAIVRTVLKWLPEGQVGTNFDVYFPPNREKKHVFYSQALSTSNTKV